MVVLYVKDKKYYGLGKVIQWQGEYVYVRVIGGNVVVAYARDVRIIRREA